MSWIYDEYKPDRMLALAYELAAKSPDDSNQNGALVVDNHRVLSHGMNHFYPGVPPTQERPAKYERVVHAEADACLSLAASSRLVTPQTIMFCPWATCKPCAISLLGSRIPTLVIHYDRCLAFMQTRAGQDASALQDWQPDIDESSQWLKDGGCETVVHCGPVPFDGTVLINGRPWSPATLEFTDGK